MRRICVPAGLDLYLSCGSLFTRMPLRRRFLILLDGLQNAKGQRYRINLTTHRWRHEPTGEDRSHGDNDDTQHNEYQDHKHGVFLDHGGLTEDNFSAAHHAR